MTLIHQFAPAKLNLYLHITGRRSDGYHDLDSLVAFATIGDEIRLRAADVFSFSVEGPQADMLRHEDDSENLVVAAAQSLVELTGHNLNVALTLVKNLPVASGIGGGSSDAAATLRALAQHWGLAPDDARLMQAAVRHGQDVPLCLKIENTYMTATGVMAAPKLPRAAVVLVNPGKGLSTPLAYREYREGGYAFAPISQLEKTPTTVGELTSALKLRGNSFYEAACQMMPEITAIIAALEASSHCLLARMSGSGATCFGIYADDVSAKAAAAQIRAAYPRWWVEAGAINV